MSAGCRTVVVIENIRGIFRTVVKYVVIKSGNLCRIANQSFVTVTRGTIIKSFKFHNLFTSFLFFNKIFVKPGAASPGAFGVKRSRRERLPGFRRCRGSG